MKTRNVLIAILLLIVCVKLAFVLHSLDEPVDTTNVAWQDKGVYWGAETNHIKAGLWMRYSTNVTNQTLVQIVPVIYNGSVSNDIAAYPVGGAFLWLPPLASRYKMELYSSNGVVVPKTSEGKMFGRKMDLHPKPVPIGGAGRYFKEPGYVEFIAKVDETNQIGVFLPTGMTPAYPSFEPFVLQDLFKIKEPGKYRLAFEIRALKRKFSMFNDLEPYYLPVNVEIEIKKPK